MDKAFKCSACGKVFLADEMRTTIHPGGCYEADYGVFSEFDSHNYYSAYELNTCPECWRTEEDTTFTSGYICNLCEGFDPYMDEDSICCEACGERIWDKAMHLLAEFRPDELDYILENAKDIIKDTQHDWNRLVEENKIEREEN